MIFSFFNIQVVHLNQTLSIYGVNILVLNPENTSNFDLIGHFVPDLLISSKFTDVDITMYSFKIVDYCRCYSVSMIIFTSIIHSVKNMMIIIMVV